MPSPASSFVPAAVGTDSDCTATRSAVPACAPRMLLSPNTARAAPASLIETPYCLTAARTPVPNASARSCMCMSPVPTIAFSTPMAWEKL